MITSQNFRPQLYISSGETDAFFTLRETYLHERWFKGEGGQPQCETEVRSFHHKNLSQSADEAMTKALLASKDLNIPMATTEESRILSVEMRDIKRSNEEQMLEREQAHRMGIMIRNQAWAEENDARLMDRLTGREHGIHQVGFGKYAHMTYADAIALDPKYFEWLLEQNQKDDKYNNDTQNAFIELYLERAEPAVESQYFGEVGKRSNGIEATVTFMKNFDSEWGTTTLYLMKTEAGEELAIFTSAGFPSIGTKVRFNAMIKDHEDRDGVKQTKLQRPTKIEELM